MVSPGLLAVALLAYSIHEHQEGHLQRIHVRVDGDLLTIDDDGRGMGLDRPGYVGGLLGTIIGQTGRIELHGVGLSLVAASCPRMSIESGRPDGGWRQTFRLGIAEAPPQRTAAAKGRGTRWEVLLPGPMSDLDLQIIESQVDRWSSSHPTCVIDLTAEPKFYAGLDCADAPRRDLADL